MIILRVISFKKLNQSILVLSILLLMDHIQLIDFLPLKFKFSKINSVILSIDKTRFPNFHFVFTEQICKVIPSKL